MLDVIARRRLYLLLKLVPLAYRFAMYDFLGDYLPVRDDGVAVGLGRIMTKNIDILNFRGTYNGSVGWLIQVIDYMRT